MSNWVNGDRTSTSAPASSWVSLIAPSAADSPISMKPAGRVLWRWYPMVKKMIICEESKYIWNQECLFFHTQTLTTDHEKVECSACKVRSCSHAQWGNPQPVTSWWY